MRNISISPPSLTGDALAIVPTPYARVATHHQPHPRGAAAADAIREKEPNAIARDGGGGGADDEWALMRTNLAH